MTSSAADHPNLADIDHPLDTPPATDGGSRGATDGPLLSPAEFTQKLLSHMATLAECHQALADIAQQVRSGESFQIHEASRAASALAIRIGQGARHLLELTTEARRQERARDRAIGIGHPTRRADGRTPNPDVAFAALRTAVEDGAETYTPGPVYVGNELRNRRVR